MNELALLITIVVSSVLLFLLVRKIIWWYFGIDQHLDNQQTIIDLLKAQLELEQITQNQAARRRSESSQPSAQSEKQSNPTRPRSPLQP